MSVLAGDIGGTKSWLQISEFNGHPHRVLVERRYPSAAYLSSIGVYAACFGVAGPVIQTYVHQSVHLTNLPWSLHSVELAQTLG